MKIIAVCFLYVLAQILYLSPYLPSTRFIYAFGIATHVAFVGYLCGLIQRRLEGITEDERLLIQYVKYLCVANVIYLFACAWKETSFAIYNTPLFAYILGIGFVSFLIHCAIKK